MNKTEGVSLCIKGVEASSAAAALYLAELFYQGDIIVKNDTAAYQYYKLANPRRNPLAAYRLGKFYERGAVVKQDEEKSLYYYEMAANQGHSDAYLNCGIHYWNSYTQLKDDRAKMLAKTYLWISAAEIAADSQDCSRLGIIYIDDIITLRNAVMKEMPDSWQSTLDKKVAQHFASLKNL